MGDIDWVSRMARMPDEDLLGIASATEDDGYHQDAIDAAKAELVGRNLDSDTLDRVEAQLEEERDRQAAKADIPLSNAGWAAFAIFGIVIFWPLVAAYVLNSRGYRRKAKEALWAIPASIALWWGGFFLISIVAYVFS